MMDHYTEKAPLPWNGDDAAEHVGKDGALAVLGSFDRRHRRDDLCRWRLQHGWLVKRDKECVIGIAAKEFAAIFFCSA